MVFSEITSDIMFLMTLDSLDNLIIVSVQIFIFLIGTYKKCDKNIIMIQYCFNRKNIITTVKLQSNISYELTT